MSSSSPYQKKAPWDRSNKYWCKYCGIFVFDNRSSRSQHESGAKHRDNVQKYLRQIGKDAEAKSHAEAKLSAQLAKIEEAAAQSYLEDVGSGADAPLPAGTSATHGALATGATAGDVAERKAHDSDATGDAGAASDAPRSDRPAHMGVVGAWEVVEEPDDPQPQDGDDADDDEKAGGAGDQTGGGEPGILGLRGAELLDDEDGQAHLLEGFEIKEKTLEPAVGGPDADSNGAAVATFKKRRAPASRPTRKQRKV
ncbi:hypothetical protein LPJ61_002016 [Coemansia biformis]|uniref:Matrin-type domain-containing protein n=1 Tax=Coemansia biformis TaxID=1286918 RepID=A0A9W7YFT6_9FUNG|nr:hypothetical protein LPJ61_002016 [Coemansia biformis]